MRISSNFPKEEFCKVLERAGKGDVEAQYIVGVAYRRGWGTKENWQRSFSWLMQAADKGHTNAKAYTRVVFKAPWIMKAARRGNPQAQVFVGNMYSSGDGVKRNNKLAIEWYLKAFKNGYVRAAFFLAKAYRQIARELGDEICYLTTKKEACNKYYDLWLAKGAKGNDSDCEDKIEKCLQDYLGRYKDINIPYEKHLDKEARLTMFRCTPD